MFADIKELKNNLEKALGKPISERKVESYTAFHVKKRTGVCSFLSKANDIGTLF